MPVCADESFPRRSYEKLINGQFKFDSMEADCVVSDGGISELKWDYQTADDGASALRGGDARGAERR